jgi:hypothetical protein
LFFIHGFYYFRPRRIAFRNDYCRSCAQPRRSVQIRTFDAWHLFWIPLLPLGFHKRWRCTACGREPHIYPGTRRGFKWVGLFILLLSSVAFWALPLTPDVTPDVRTPTWIFRIAAPLGAIFTLRHLLRTHRDPSLKEKLAGISPAEDTVCPFCNSQLLLLSSQCSCPTCGIVRS